MLLSNRVAIITGGARGIGRAMALRFADEGCKIVIADLRGQEAAETLRQISERKSEGIFARCDVTKYEQIREMVEMTTLPFNPIPDPGFTFIFIRQQNYIAPPP